MVDVMPLVGFDSGYFAVTPQVERQASRELRGISQDEFVIEFVGRLIEAKGVLELLEAFRAVREKANLPNTRLVFIGKGPLKSCLVQFLPHVLVISVGSAKKSVPTAVSRTLLSFLLGPPLDGVSGSA